MNSHHASRDQRMHPVRCDFFLRTPAEGGKSFYDRIFIKGPSGSGSLTTFHPPAIGDLLPLRGERGAPGGTFRVVDRIWCYPECGSAAWPQGAREGDAAPEVNLVVEKCDSPFQDESDLPSPFEGK